jgi:hypothetical protein
MPRSRAPGTRARVSKRQPKAQVGDEWIVCPPPTKDEMFQSMREALYDAMGLAQALHLMGLGLVELGRDEGDAVKTVAEAMNLRRRSGRPGSITSNPPGGEGGPGFRCAPSGLRQLPQSRPNFADRQTLRIGLGEPPLYFSQLFIG